MQTPRDAAIVDWIGRLGAARAEDVRRRFGMGRSWSYARLSLLVGDGLLVQRTVLYRQPGLYLATAEGLRWQGLGRLGVYHVGPGTFEHARQVTAAATALHLALPDWRVMSEREIRMEEADEGVLVASIRLGALPEGRAALHRPDLALVAPDGRVVAVEVELSVKAPRRLAAICRGYARARHIDTVYYLAARAPALALSRAIKDTRAEERITVLPLADTDTLAAVEREARHGRR